MAKKKKSTTSSRRKVKSPKPYTKVYKRRKKLSGIARFLGSLVVLPSLLLFVIAVVSGAKSLMSDVNLTGFMAQRNDSGTKNEGGVDLREKTGSNDVGDSSDSSSSVRVDDGKYLFRVAVMSDSENSFDNLEKALELAKNKKVDFVIFLGDHTKWGDETSLMKSKQVLDSSGLNYYSIPGDHDLAKSVQSGDPTGLRAYKYIFGTNYHAVSTDRVNFVILDNSANYSPVDDVLMHVFRKDVLDADAVFLAQPLYNCALTRSMGVLDGEEIEGVREQAIELLDLIRNNNVKVVVSADLHYSSTCADPVDKNLEHISIGALIDMQEDSQIRNLQTPRFLIMTYFEDKSYETEVVEL